ncbi:MAG: hypothetical protein E6I65_12660 [Chloroflexi bacterium]|nr:MAG: hypothetical protein E6I65_12660 [Chloroflexota bacterium]
MAVHEQRHLDPLAADMIVTASGWRDARNARQRRHISTLPVGLDRSHRRGPPHGYPAAEAHPRRNIIAMDWAFVAEDADAYQELMDILVDHAAVGGEERSH